MPLTEEHGTSLIRTAALALVAIAGLLAMHGFEGASLTLTGTSHMTGTRDEAPPAHAAIGICVFVASMVGIGMAAVRTSRARPGFAAAGSSQMAGVLLRPTWSSQVGRSLLIDLRVLRL